MVTTRSDVKSVLLCFGADQVLHTGASIEKHACIDTVDCISGEVTTCTISDVGICLHHKGSVFAGTVGEELDGCWAYIITAKLKRLKGTI